MITLTIEQMKILRDKGLNCSNASTYWYGSKNWKNDRWYVDSYSLTISTRPIKLSIETIPAFTLEDILNILPNYTIVYQGLEVGIYKIAVCYGKDEIHYEDAKTLIEAAYNSLIWYLDNNFIK